MHAPIIFISLMEIVPKNKKKTMMMSTHSSLLFLGGGKNSVATLALGSRPKQRACKVANQEGSPGVTSHALGV
jgi:hypothetical protein